MTSSRRTWEIYEKIGLICPMSIYFNYLDHYELHRRF